MKIRTLIFFIALLIMSSCGALRKSTLESQNDFRSFPELKAYCDSAKTFSSLFIHRIDSEFVIDDERYDAKLSVYYIPDSIIFLTASNTGFEIVRALVTKDSLILINRLDKMAYSYKKSDSDLSSPFYFQDIEYLINKVLVCGEIGAAEPLENRIFFNRSVQDVRKAIYYRVQDLSLDQFEFFNKKTNEYIVGEMNQEKQLEIYSNFIIDDLRIIARGGQMEFGRQIDASVKYNRRKYITIAL